MSRLIRPSSSSSPQSPQVEPGGRCVQRFGTGFSFPLLYRPVGLTIASTEPSAKVAAHEPADLTSPRPIRRPPPRLVVSADGHVLEPTDLFKTRLPKHLRERGVWEEDFEIEPMVEGGARIFRRLHTPGFDGWTISRYRQTGGRMPEGDPEHILEDMALDGVDVQVMHPNLSLFGLYSDDHELSMGHARVYNDYIVERFSPYFSKLAPTAPMPITDIADAVAEIERVAAGGLPGDPAAGDAAGALLLARLSTRSGTRRRPTACRSSSTPRPAG